eukprot:9773790-Alexandrium_andersonii.AAC.1
MLTQHMLSCVGHVSTSISLAFTCYHRLRPSIGQQSRDGPSPGQRCYGQRRRRLQPGAGRVCCGAMGREERVGWGGMAP